MGERHNCSKEMQGFEEVLAPKRRARIFFVRHGVPEVYGNDKSKLTQEGIDQVESFAETFIDILRMDRKEKLLKILSSDRNRAAETAKIIEQRVKERKRRSPWGMNVELMPTIAKRGYITPHRTIDPVIQNGTPLSSAYNTWLDLSYPEAKELNARWSGEIASEAFTLARRLGNFVAESDGPDIYYVLATHETTLGSILLHSGVGDPSKIGFAEHLEIESFGDRMSIRSRGEQGEFDSQEITERIQLAMQ